MLVEDRKDTKSPEVEEQITHHLDYTIYQRIYPAISVLYTKHNLQKQTKWINQLNIFILKCVTMI